MTIVDLSQVIALAADLAVAGVEAKAEAKVITRKVGAEVQDDSQADAPVLTGELRESVFLRRDGDDVIVGSDTRQGFYQEFGTSRHGPQPWLFRNGERGGDEMVKLLGEIDPL